MEVPILSLVQGGEALVMTIVAEVLVMAVMVVVL